MWRETLRAGAELGRVRHDPHPSTCFVVRLRGPPVHAGSNTYTTRTGPCSEPGVVSVSELSARAIRTLVEEETLLLKRAGWSFREIAAWLNQMAMSDGPESSSTLRLPSDFRTSPADCRKALKRALKRNRTMTLREMCLLDSERCEGLYKALARKAMNGDPLAAEAAIRVLEFRAALHATYLQADLPGGAAKPGKKDFAAAGTPQISHVSGIFRRQITGTTQATLPPNHSQRQARPRPGSKRP